ncbi:MAG: hypothetical protein H0V49_03575 [Nocardioidaceae bacterium]|nr:hypothetical protein [Nocardioidaceae bacterium]
MTAQPSRDDAERALRSETTGDQRVDGAVARLDQLDELDLDEHGQVYDEISAALHDVLDGAPEPALVDLENIRPA